MENLRTIFLNPKSSQIEISEKSIAWMSFYIHLFGRIGCGQMYFIKVGLRILTSSKCIDKTTEDFMKYHLISNYEWMSVLRTNHENKQLKSNPNLSWLEISYHMKKIAFVNRRLRKKKQLVPIIFQKSSFPIKRTTLKIKRKLSIWSFQYDIRFVSEWKMTKMYHHKVYCHWYTREETRVIVK